MAESASLGPYTSEVAHNAITGNLSQTILVSKEATRVFQLILYGIVIQSINVFGIGTNVINMMCFIKQGLKEPVNASLFGLAVSDTGCLVTMVWVCVCFIPHFQDADLPFDPPDTLYLTFGMPHLVFTRATCCITALVMLERCLCITMPLKVHAIFTSKRIAITIGCIYLLLICFVSPLYVGGRFDMKYYPERNISRIGLVFTIDRTFLEQISYTLGNVFGPFTALLIIFVSMIIIAIFLRKQAQWRMKLDLLKSTAARDKYVRDQRVSKMVIIISTMFVICFAPSAIIFIAVVIEPKINFDGKFQNISIISYTLTFVFESLNSSLNIFVYYNMSSKYKSIFRQLFFKLTKG